MGTWLQRRPGSIAILAGAFLVALLSVLALGAQWRRDNAEPSLRVLGSGNRLSVLITSGEARVLIATGNDAADFGNALAGALRPPSRRIDVLILAGGNGDLPVASRAIRDHPEAEAFILNGPLIERAGDLGIPQDQVIARPTTLTLPGAIEIDLMPSAEVNGGWSATVRRGATMILVASDPEVLAGIRAPRSVVIVSRGFGNDAPERIDSPALVVPTGQASIAGLSTPGGDRPLAVVLVENGGVARLRFVDGGIQLPENARLLSPSPRDE
jgi:hypothetical protein